MKLASFVRILLTVLRQIYLHEGEEMNGSRYAVDLLVTVRELILLWSVWRLVY